MSQLLIVPLLLGSNSVSLSGKHCTNLCGGIQIRLEQVVDVMLEEGVEPLEEGVVEAQVQRRLAHRRRELAHHVPA